MTSLKVHSSKHIKNEDSFSPSALPAEGLFFPASPALPLLSSPLLPSALLLPLAAQPSCSSSSCSSLLSSLAAPSPCPFLCRGGSYQREARWCRAAPPPIPAPAPPPIPAAQQQKKQKQARPGGQFNGAPAVNPI
ncbi:MAG: hypothetical protein HDS23_00180 [Bacteroides sp.]|nr:hypothetical protein [Bacteroides sp.]